MKCLLTSDTHYGFTKNTHKIHQKFLKDIQKQIKEQKIDIVIHAGDWSCISQESFYKTLKMFREYIKIPILSVRGNHDLWIDDKDRYKSSYRHLRRYDDLLEAHKNWYDEFDIHDLNSNIFILDDVMFIGHDGWYGKIQTGTNDIKNIPIDISTEKLGTIAHNALQRNLDLIDFCKGSKVIVYVTHMPAFTENPIYLKYCASEHHLKAITEVADVYCLGHSHRRAEGMKINKALTYNAGSDYDKPKYVIFETPMLNGVAELKT